jgi:hypothetical protein
MRTTTIAVALLAAALVSPATPALAQQPDAGITVAGVTMPPTIEAGGQQLLLNGVALRKKFVVKVYVAGLYLHEKSKDANAILAADAPRLLRMQFVYDVGKEKMCEAWDESLKNNTPGADAQLQGEFKELCGWMQDLKKGDVMTFTYLPGTGTSVDVQGQHKGTVAGKPFADALFKSWIGPKPGPGESFKSHLLGAEE